MSVPVPGCSISHPSLEGTVAVIPSRRGPPGGRYDPPGAVTPPRRRTHPVWLESRRCTALGRDQGSGRGGAGRRARCAVPTTSWRSSGEKAANGRSPSGATRPTRREAGNAWTATASGDATATSPDDEIAGRNSPLHRSVKVRSNCAIARRTFGRRGRVPTFGRRGWVPAIRPRRLWQ